MGNFLSGRFGKGRGKKAVHECLRLDVQYFKHMGTLRSDYTAYVTMNWPRGSRNPDALERSRVCCNVSHVPPRAIFSHEFTGRPSYHQEIFLTPSETEFQGHRWWWECPECNRRVRYLYLPEGEQGFKCRLCSGLTFQSCRDSHRHDSLFRYVAKLMGIDFREAKEVIEGHWARVGITISAT